MKRKMLSVLLIIGLSLCLTTLSGCGAPTVSRNEAGVGSTEAEETQNSGTAAETAAADQSAQASSGELRYSGISSAENIESISVTFVLSEDKSNIHDFTIFITGFHGTARISGATVSVEVTGQTQTIMNEIPVDYEGANRNLSVGDSTIESLRFNEDGSADLVFTYCFKQTTPQSYEIPVAGIAFELNAAPAPESGK